MRDDALLLDQVSSGWIKLELVSESREILLAASASWLALVVGWLVMGVGGEWKA